MKKPQTQTLARFSIAALLILSACGGHAEKQGDPISADPAAGTVPSASTPGTLPTTGTTDDFNPAYKASFSIVGAGTQSFDSITTDSHLRIRVTPGASGKNALPGYDSYISSYGCASFKVTASTPTSTVTIPLPTMSVDGTDPVCQNAKKSEIADFDHWVVPGRKDPITITIIEARYDFKYWNCIQYPNLYNALFTYPTSCNGYKDVPVYRNHTVTGTAEFEIDTVD